MTTRYFDIRSSKCADSIPDVVYDSTQTEYRHSGIGSSTAKHCATRLAGKCADSKRDVVYDSTQTEYRHSGIGSNAAKHCATRLAGKCADSKPDVVYDSTQTEYRHSGIGSSTAKLCATRLAASTVVRRTWMAKPKGKTSAMTSVRAKAHHRLESLSWMRKQRLIYALMVFVSVCYGFAMYTMYENMESINAETTNLRVQSIGAEGGREVLGYCNVQTVWNASEDVGLSLVDFGVLAALAYEPQSDDTKDVLTAWFSDSSSRVTMWESSAYPEACGRPGATTRLFDVTPSSGGPPRTVLSIRGTVDFKDWFEDIALWGPVMIADIATQILPFGTSWGAVIPDFLRATRILNAGSYANELMDCVRELKSNATARNSRLYLTGHSLGGGLASLLGAREDVPNAVFSAPGSELSIGLLAEDKLDELRRNTINVIPDGDLVPQVDRSAFYAQKIECTDESLLRPIECHSIVRTVNTLAELCGASHRLLKESEVPP
ncbi:Hypothetical Protein FCC1311_101572 [Hondaea fermentalgiana]|uniref:Fungal lipase-type domain-containing protein n=1 Tax=Hondaea fermentalgiana TaxID=2315210 RepID=A0A2R5H0T7_9STRA|nr:Hypothetical Protein FCC1311_101572 [Hondaea fermentalgiana]|eukprot:GBG33934.1 Hypothetical Protein FCC1311_101572 [Hondaea fermentalgiana]